MFHSCSAYENYFSNFRTNAATTLAVQSLTRYPDLSRAFVPPIEEFERWYEADWPSISATSEAASIAITAQRVQRREMTPEGAQQRKWLLEQRQAGRPVICLLGKVLFDQGAPVKEGLVHAHMRDWFEHTAAFAARNENLILLVKPHPHELRNEIALYPTELLSDWMPLPRPDNVIFLPHNLFNLSEVAEMIDMGLIWNGSASMELGALEVPCVVATRFGHLDFPVGHEAPTSRENYEELLQNARTLRAKPGVGDRSRALIHYLRTENVSIPYRYTVRSLTNRRVRRLAWIDEDLQRYDREGDRFVDLITSNRSWKLARAGLM